jgi:2-polyprenyl-3-methyl-5-hydroxy-6-metoxy-1,4-benzoquinol methylase/uncharacterized protein YbaR (Trm112 family)
MKYCSQLMPGLACPICQSDLVQSSEGVSCIACSQTWPVRMGIPRFDETDAYFGEPGITRELLQKIVQKMRSKNWHEVLKADLPSEFRSTYEFLADLSRANWHKLIGLPKESVVLDIGAGMGTISEALGREYRAVYAIEQVPERAEFMENRFAQEGCTNIHVFQTDIDHLPFRPGSFDLIVLNGVLEWLPFKKPQMSPGSAQRYYLTRLKQLLKPNGVLYVGIENRTCYSYFLGAQDPHSPLRYVTILPRVLAHIVSKLMIGEAYRPYIYSAGGYRRLFKKAGFPDIQIYSALPSYNKPTYIIPLSEHSAAFADLIMISNRVMARMIKSILIKVDLLKYLGYSYGLVARNSESSSQSLNRS